MIQIKSRFFGWKEVSREKAKEYVLHLRKAITTMEGKVLDEYINENKIKGITVDELLVL